MPKVALWDDEARKPARDGVIGELELDASSVDVDRDHVSVTHGGKRASSSGFGAHM